jgi:hypothetical protein
MNQAFSSVHPPRIAPDDNTAAVPMAKGGDFWVTKPTLFLAGEAGPERATFSGANNRGAKGGTTVLNITVQGSVISEGDLANTVAEAVRLNTGGSYQRFQAALGNA